MTLQTDITRRAMENAASPSLSIVIIGLSITSSWGNGHATTYRGLVRELAKRGHHVLFLEHDKPWYAENRDMPQPPYGHTELYSSLDDLKRRFADEVRNADLVIVGSYVPQGVEVGDWVTRTSRGISAFYDIDTPVTLSKLAKGDYEYLSPGLIPRYQLYLSFTGGPTLDYLQDRYGSPQARALYCSVDPDLYYPQPCHIDWDMGYLGTYSPDRQPGLERLMLQVAERQRSLRFAVAGPLYPDDIPWPANVERIYHLPPADHRAFYNAQRFTLNVTRADMIRAGHSPSVRLFEAAACGVPIISDWWEGLDSIFVPNEEILISQSSAETLYYLTAISEPQRQRIGIKARQRILNTHTAAHRACELEHHVLSLMHRVRW